MQPETTQSTIDRETPPSGDDPSARGGSPLRSFFPRLFSSLRHRNYRLFFMGQWVSTSGTWMQQPAMQWLTWTMKGSSIYLGLLTAMGAIPMTLLSPVGGLIAERFDRRRILMVTQPLLMIAPLALATLLLIDASYVRIWHLMVVALANGTIMAFDVPARQSLVVTLVGREDLPNAIALNSFVFNVSRTLGPAIGMAMFTLVSPAACFGANGLSYLALISGLGLMRTPQKPAAARARSSKGRHPWGGFLYVWTRREIRATIILLSACTIFGWSLLSQLSAFTQVIFGQKAGVFGGFLSVFGAGAFMGALAMAYLSRHANRRGLILVGVGMFVVSIAAFTSLSSYGLAMIPMFFAGSGLLMGMSGINSHVQMLVSERFRGRVMGVYAMFFGGMMPVGAMLTGYMAQRISLTAAAQINMAALTVVAAGVILYWRSLKRRGLLSAGRG